MQHYTIGFGSPRTAVIGCQHGDELIGRDIIERLVTVRPDKGTLDLIIANEEAIDVRTRFLDSDLNRIFPGNSTGNREEQIAADLTHRLKPFDYVIDVHSTTACTQSFVVITGLDEQAKQLASLVPLPKVVYMEPQIAQGRSLIDHANAGISIEFDERTSPNHGYNVVLGALKAMGMYHGTVSAVMQEFYSVYGVLRESVSQPLVNFKLTALGDNTFYPVFFGEKAYAFTCMMAKKI
ncbi:succinylglutamate desuccinylase/aspartoacylase family protein [Candidatus Woesearchaeota archaeon]|nr:succinylglutamate desuccinylase/aspartoacylase family protein [Candidatus Woesearchaeota archaeon]